MPRYRLVWNRKCFAKYSTYCQCRGPTGNPTFTDQPVSRVQEGGTDPDGTGSGYLWTPKISRPTAGTITNANTAATTVTGMTAGTYKFVLRVTDNSGAFGRDTMQVIVNPAPNIPPTANAGADQVITLPTNSISLSGSGTNPDGSCCSLPVDENIRTNGWTITNANTAATTVTGMAAGTYKFELRVTDNSGAFGRDTMQVLVNPAS